MHIEAATLATSLAPSPLIERLQLAFAAGAETPLRSVHALGAGTVLGLMPCWRDGERAAIKIFLHAPGNAARGGPTVQATVLVYDVVTGALLGSVDGTELTLRRTAAVSALAAGHLARGDAATLLVVGTGALAPHMARAHCAVRPYRRIRVWGRNRQRLIQMCKSLAAEGIPAEPIEPGSLPDAVRGADVISCATSSTEPLVRGSWLADGSHLDLVGSYLPGMQECDAAAILDGELYVDTRAGALAESGELLALQATGSWSADRIRGDLRQLVTGAVPGRQDPHARTVFKSVGTGLADLAAAELALGCPPPVMPAAGL